ncbi:MAG: hypothetical protein NXI14_08935 [bacterium]|nr:hypothetical protein [bacterium]
MTDAPITKAMRDRIEVAVACLDRLAALVASWRPTDDGYRVADDRDAWVSTAQAALDAVDRVLDGLDAGRLCDAATTCRCRIDEVLRTDRLISACVVDRMRSARTALGIAGQVIRPTWATIPLRYIKSATNENRPDNLLRRLRIRHVRHARCSGEVYAHPHDLVAVGILTVEQIADFLLTTPSEHPQTSSRPSEAVPAS